MKLFWVKRYYNNTAAPWAQLLRYCFYLCLKRPVTPKEITDPWLQTEISYYQISNLPRFWASTWKLWKENLRPHIIITPATSETWGHLPVKHMPEAALRGRAHATINALMRELDSNTLGAMEPRVPRAILDKFTFPADPGSRGTTNWGESLLLKLDDTIAISQLTSKRLYQFLRDAYCRGEKTVAISPQALKTLWSLKLRPKTRQRVWRILTDRLPTKIDPVHNPTNACGCGKGSATPTHLFSACEIFQNLSDDIRRSWNLLPFRNDPKTLFTAPHALPGGALGLRVYSTLLQAQWLCYCNWVKQGIAMTTASGMRSFAALIKREAQTDRDISPWLPLLRVGEARAQSAYSQQGPKAPD